MQVKQGRKKRVNLKKRFIQQARTFEAFGNVFSEGISDRAIRRDEVLAQVCIGLSRVCKMLAEHIKEGHNHGGDGL